MSAIVHVASSMCVVSQAIEMASGMSPHHGDHNRFLQVHLQVTFIRFRLYFSLLVCSICIGSFDLWITAAANKKSQCLDEPLKSEVGTFNMFSRFLLVQIRSFQFFKDFCLSIFHSFIWNSSKILSVFHLSAKSVMIISFSTISWVVVMQYF